MKSILLLIMLIPLACNGQYFKDYMEIAFNESKRGNYENAISYCNKAIEYDRNSPIPYVLRSVCKNQLNDYRGVLIDCRTAIKLHPTDKDLGQIYLNLGFASYKLGYESNGCMYMKKSLSLGVNQAYEFINQFCN